MHVVTVKRPIAIHLNVQRAITLKEKGLLDVLAIPSDLSSLNAVLCDPFLFAAVLWECTDQDGQQFDDFTRLICPDNLEDFAEAFTREVIGFFPNTIRAVIQNALASDETTTDPSTPGEPSGSSPASSESIPDPSPCDSSTTWPSDDSRPNGHEVPN